MDLCAYCHTAIVDPARAFRDPEGFLLDRECARQLAREGGLTEVDAPVMNQAGRITGYRRLRWDAALDDFTAIPG